MSYMGQSIESQLRTQIADAIQRQKERIDKIEMQVQQMQRCADRLERIANGLTALEQRFEDAMRHDALPPKELYQPR